MGLLVVELPFGSNLLIEYIEIFHLGEIAFDGLYGLRLLCQAAFKLCLLRPASETNLGFAERTRIYRCPSGQTIGIK